MSETKRLIYLGQRFWNGKLHDTFASDEDDEQKGDTSFAVGRTSRWWFVIGHQYDVPLDGEAFKLGPDDAVDIGEVLTDERIEHHSMLTQAASEERRTIKAIQKLQKANRNRWREALKPLRDAMMQASPVQKQAIRLAVLNELNVW